MGQSGLGRRQRSGGTTYAGDGAKWRVGGKREAKEGMRRWGAGSNAGKLLVVGVGVRRSGGAAATAMVETAMAATRANEPNPR